MSTYMYISQFYAMHFRKTDLAFLLKVLKASLLQQGKRHMNCHHCSCVLTHRPAVLHTNQTVLDAAVMLAGNVVSSV
jgi:hypothetical protein